MVPALFGHRLTKLIPPLCYSNKGFRFLNGRVVPTVPSISGFLCIAQKSFTKINPLKYSWSKLMQGLPTPAPGSSARFGKRIPFGKRGYNLGTNCVLWKQMMGIISLSGTLNFDAALIKGW